EFESNLNDLEIDLVSISLYKQSINVIDISDDIYFLSIDLDRRESRVHSSLGAMNELIDNFINTLTESVTLNDFINLIMTNSIGGCDFYPFAEIMVEFVVLNDLEVKEGKCKSCNINDFIEYLIVC
ncbi:TPA: hypothetical protein I8W54_004327, partial [Morganella morganii]|nr:hypothetical protein [Morganella morganii]